MEPDASIEPIAYARPGFDPSNLVPDEYDILCDGCGYSLVGIQSDKCPECGKTFEPNELPFARVAWLHRRKIGRIKAYRWTFWAILLRPKQFAAELCRPVRISIADARQFRRVTVWIVLGACILSLLEIIGVGVALFIHEAVRSGVSYAELAFGMLWLTVEAGTALIGLRALLYLATDLPVFIWKGHPSLRAKDLSPIQCYTCAPLALLGMLPLLLIGFGVLALVEKSYYRLGIVDGAIEAVIWGGPGLLLLILLVTTLRLMQGSGVNRRQIVLMGVYLPFHWLIMIFVCSAIAGIAMALEQYGFEKLAESFRL